jgi:hypothetical protein
MWSLTKRYASIIAARYNMYILRLASSVVVNLPKGGDNCNKQF